MNAAPRGDAAAAHKPDGSCGRRRRYPTGSRIILSDGRNPKGRVYLEHVGDGNVTHPDHKRQANSFYRMVSEPAGASAKSSTYYERRGPVSESNRMPALRISSHFS